MSISAYRRTAGIVAGLAAVTLVAAGCSSDRDEKTDSTHSASVQASAPAVSSATSAESTAPSEEPSAAPESDSDVTLESSTGREVTLTGPIAVKYSSASEQQKKDLGKPLGGDHNAGTRDSGVVFQQFEGGVITAVNDDASTPAYITWGEIRDAWNVERDETGKPDESGMNGSAGPLGAPTSDETADGDLRTTTFQNGKITYNTKTGKIQVTVNGKVNPEE
ncbi:hypothetical protein GOHSU_18_00010 [Gordonia hirsuta DSM 44140 = NBRC 16056]|uniref:LGFP repeat-containing protein n=1 Tax=Gordonia hirsuta DSM 44140 = NBRC 16056 TaxID=1121927 RepID=L7L908_9ACTN|nr:hypothetical protein [Gordonia hirsuta]GAC57246.1 hypothetical protein GOHSU_18_00010 [Gordonia hirsuta DSM 44140 = NBRC 16056]